MSLRDIAGGVLAVGLVVAVAVVVVGAVVWAAERTGLVKVSQRGMVLVGRAVLGGFALGALSGIVGFGMEVFPSM